MKLASAALNTHLQLEVTSLATCWRITRQDGIRFHFTEHDVDLIVNLDGTGLQTYSASSSYNRSAIKGTEQLSVDTLDITGVLDNDDIKESELRLGLFDFASVEIFLVNHDDLTQGVIKLRKGRLGEITVTPNGFFLAELRGLLQAYQQKIGELYSPECRADLGDERCKIPILPTLVPRSTAFILGDFVRATNDLAFCVLLVPADDDTANDRSPLGVTGTLGAKALVQETTKIVGDGAIEFDGSAPTNPSTSFVSFPDNAAYSIAAGEFNVECHARFKSIGAGVQTFGSHWSSASDQRGWTFEATSSVINFVFTTDGTAGTVITIASNAVTLFADTDYHFAVSRDSSGDIRIFLDGVQVNTTANDTSSIHNSTAVFYLGKKLDTVVTDHPIDGFVDDFRFFVGRSIYTSGFTAPVTPHSNVDNVVSEDLDDRVYVVTTAGTTATVQPTFDTVVGNTTTDGSVVFTAEEAFSRSIEVITVSGSKPRKIFTVTELTPNTGGPRGGFADDFINGGAVTWESGLNAGASMEVKDFTADDGATIEQILELFLNMPFDIQVGDKARVYPGCDKSFLAACRDKFDNVINFRGEPYIPGADLLFKIPDAKA